MLGDADAIFVRELAIKWQAEGLNVVVVTRQHQAAAEIAPGIPIVRSPPFERLPVAVARRALRPLLSPLERLATWVWKPAYRRRTGQSDMKSWEWPFVNITWDALAVARAALSLKPRFVYGQQVCGYGLATAWCRGVPRIAFPWGSDIYFSAESSWIYYRLVRHALRNVDLVVPTSTEAARHLVERFGVDPAKVKTLTWGVDLRQFTAADEAQRRARCAAFGIDPDRVIVLHARHFMGRFGALVALEAFLELARENPQTHFVIIRGNDVGADNVTDEARRRITDSGLAEQFTIFDEWLPLEKYREVASVADVAVSLYARGDMRSLSVLQTAASGAVPVLADTPQFRDLRAAGFCAELVNAESPASVLGALRRLAGDAERRRELAAGNATYLREHEDETVAIRRMLAAINEICNDYSRR